MVWLLKNDNTWILFILKSDTKTGGQKRKMGEIN